MGCNASLLNTSERDYAEKNHNRLYQYISQNNKKSTASLGANQLKPIKMILLGSGESGKSTIVKQMKVIHSNGFDKNEALNFIPIINSNILTSLMAILNRLGKMNVKIGCEREVGLFNEYVQDYEMNQNKIIQGVSRISEKAVKLIKVILTDINIVKCMRNPQKVGIGDSSVHFFSNFDRITSPGYIPSLEDIIRTRVKTVGVHETNFSYKHYQFLLTDVGGQMTERKKWIHCFHEVDVVLFVASLADYTATMIEDESKNRMRDSLELFEQILKVQFFEHSTFVLVLNKGDIFKNVVAHTPISTLFPDYTGAPHDAEQSIAFIKQKYLALNRNENRFIYTHVTCATDTSHIEVVFRSVADSLIKQDMENLIDKSVT